MSALLLDMGNSRWKLASTGGLDVGAPTVGGYDDFGALSRALDQLSGPIDSVWVSSLVEAALTRRVASQLVSRLGVPVHQVGPMDPMPNITSGYRRPGQLGVDRLVAMVAARSLTDRPFCVVDAGTAVTIDFVDVRGQHLGGFILPGERLFRDCLLRDTSIPPEGDIERDAVLGRDTTTAVALGARYAVAAIVDRFTAGATGLFADVDTKIFIGGGEADFIIPLIGRPSVRVDNLVLRGLAVLAQEGSV